jgi:hypothetical protein
MVRSYRVSTFSAMPLPNAIFHATAKRVRHEMSASSALSTIRHQSAAFRVTFFQISLDSPSNL